LVKHPNFEGFIQQDTHEFMIFLLEDINIELNENIKNIKYQEFNYTNKVSKKSCIDEFNIFFKKRQNSIIIDLFDTQLVTIFAYVVVKNLIFIFKK